MSFAIEVAPAPFDRLLGFNVAQNSGAALVFESVDFNQASGVNYGESAAGHFAQYMTVLVPANTGIARVFCPEIPQIVVGVTARFAFTLDKVIVLGNRTTVDEAIITGPGMQAAADLWNIDLIAAFQAVGSMRRLSALQVYNSCRARMATLGYAGAVTQPVAMMPITLEHAFFNIPLDARAQFLNIVGNTLLSVLALNSHPYSSSSLG